MRKKAIPRITANQQVCHGKPVFSGTRIMVWQVLELLEAGADPEEIYKSYPTLPDRAIEAALHFAAEQMKGTRYVPFDKHAGPGQIFA